MSHEVFGERYIGARGISAWHILGTTLALGEEEDISVEEAMIRAGITFPYLDVPVGYVRPDGLFVTTENRRMILRAPTSDLDEWTEMGIVSNDYRYLQNYDLAQGLDLLREKTGWKFETAGALYKGKLVFMTLRIGERSVFGDRFDTFVAVSDGKGTGKALTMSITPVRFVCANTVKIGEAAATMQIKLPHHQNVGEEYEFWLSYIDDLNRAYNGVFETMEDMARTKISDRQAELVFEAAFPEPKKSDRILTAEALFEMPEIKAEDKTALGDRLIEGTKSHDLQVQWARNHQRAAFRAYERINAGQEHGITVEGKTLDPLTLKQISNTAYTALHAAIEIADWGGSQRGHSAAASSLFGEGSKTKQQAWNMAADLIAV